MGEMVQFPFAGGNTGGYLVDSENRVVVRV